MRFTLMNIDKFVSVNNLEEVTNSIILSRGFIPTPDGILSTEIFGSTLKERKSTYAYINLKCHVMQPLAYKTYSKLERKLDAILSGTENFSIDKNGQIVADENGDTGCEWLYKNWNKIKLKKNESELHNERVDFLVNYDRDQLFQSKAIVIPAFYRDVNLQSANKGKPSINKINQPYVKLIRYASLLDQGNFAFNLNYTKFQIQMTLVELYNIFKEKVDKKRGVIKQNILGKNVDYGARMVITTAKFTAQRPADMQVDFYHTGVPLAQCVSLFTPFFVGWIQNFFRNEFERTGMKYPTKEKGQLVYHTVKNPMIQFNDDVVHDMMKKFIYSFSQRFDPIEIEMEDTDKKATMKFKGMETPDEEIPENAGRPFTLTDLFYLAACDILKDKHCYITRYPMADYMGIYPSRIGIMSTTETQEIWLDGKQYKHYPVIPEKLDGVDVASLFINVVCPSNLYLQAIGGDYDGDTITLKGVYSQEANAEAEKILLSKMNFLSVNGNNVRTTKIEAIDCVYNMTRWDNPNEVTVRG